MMVLIQFVKSFVRRVSSSIERVEKSLAERPVLRVSKLVIMSMIIVFGAKVVLANIAPWVSARVGLLYFRFDELLGFFIVMLVILLFLSWKRPNWLFERFFFRSILSLVTISVLWIFINLSDREFAGFVLVGLAVFLFLWSLTGTHLKHSVCCVLIVISLLVMPFDIVISSPLRSTEGRQASVQLLEAQYGLIRKTLPGTYSLGCMVPPNPLKWVLWIDLWPIVEQFFIAYDNFFYSSASSGHGS